MPPTSASGGDLTGDIDGGGLSQRGCRSRLRIAAGMRRVLALGLCPAAALFALSWAVGCLPAPGLGHPPSVVDSSAPDVVAAAAWAATTPNFTSGSADGEVLAVLEAQRQLVNGYNFDLVLVLDGASDSMPPSLAHARVYKRPPWMQEEGELYELSEAFVADASEAPAGGAPAAARVACPTLHASLEGAPKQLLQTLDSQHLHMDVAAGATKERYSYLLYTGEGVGGLGIAAESNSTGTFYFCIGGDRGSEGAGGQEGEELSEGGGDRDAAGDGHRGGDEPGSASPGPAPGGGAEGEGGQADDPSASTSEGLRLVFRDDQESKYGLGSHGAVLGGVVLVACLGGVGYLAFRYWRMKRTVRSYQRALELMDQEDDL